ncbi:MAG: IS3 family transposase [Pseudomonadota bacterium]
MDEYGLGERRACSLLEVSRSQARRDAPVDRNGALRTRLCELARAHPRYGSPALYDLLRREGWPVNRKRVYRLYREEGLGVRLKEKRSTALDVTVGPSGGPTGCHGASSAPLTLPEKAE